MRLVRIFKGPSHVFTGKPGENMMYLGGVVEDAAGKKLGAAIFSNGEIATTEYIHPDSIYDAAMRHVAEMLEKRGEAGSDAHRRASQARSWRRIPSFSGTGDSRRWSDVVAYWDDIVRSQWEKIGPGCPIPFSE